MGIEFPTTARQLHDKDKTGEGDRLHGWLRAMYASTVDTPPPQFAQLAIHRVAQALPCAAVLWQLQGSRAPFARHAIVLQPVPTQIDKIELTDPRSLATVAHEMHIERRQVSGSTPDLVHHLAFARLRSQPAFSESERAQLQELAEHLVSAERLCREFASRLQRRGGRPVDSDCSGFAVVDRNGRILSADQGFADVLRHTHPQWDGHTLPFAFEWHRKLASTGLVHAGLFVRIDRLGEHFRVRLRKDLRTPALSERELEIAERVARGLTFKEIARELGLAPSTVSTHLYRLYAKLGIRRRAELVAWQAKTGPRMRRERERARLQTFSTSMRSSNSSTSA